MGLLSPHAGARRPGGAYASLPGSAGGTPTHRRRPEKRVRVMAALAALALAAVLLNSGVFAPVDPALLAWSLKGCPQKILDLTTTMEDQYKVGGGRRVSAPGAGPWGVGCPNRGRRPAGGLAATEGGAVGRAGGVRRGAGAAWRGLYLHPSRLRLSTVRLHDPCDACSWRWLRGWTPSWAAPPPASPRPLSSTSCGEQRRRRPFAGAGLRPEWCRVPADAAQGRRLGWAASGGAVGAPAPSLLRRPRPLPPPLLRPAATTPRWWRWRCSTSSSCATT